MPEVKTTAHLDSLLGRLRSGDGKAREELIEASLERLRFLARQMLNRQIDLRQLCDTDDILQQSMLRLYQALQQIHPASVREYIGLAARQIRWVLLDLGRRAANVRSQFCPPNDGAALENRPPADQDEPSSIAEWTEFHEIIDKLPEEDREMFNLLFYQGLSQEEAAAILGLSVRTVKRRWQQARLHLRERLRGDSPLG
ncbi:MAG: hypothetical protein KatS3mg105_3573 [Gemmatales bacterium]|nr:MAG: hypothetical protein KatS3mg105_3573 [Gemmatales bacterium]